MTLRSAARNTRVNNFTPTERSPPKRFLFELFAATGGNPEALGWGKTGDGVKQGKTMNDHDTIRAIRAGSGRSRLLQWLRLASNALKRCNPSMHLYPSKSTERRSLCHSMANTP